MFYEDSGISDDSPSWPDKEWFERQGLIQGRVSTKQLKQSCPTAFNPSLIVLFLSYVEAERGVQFVNGLIKKLPLSNDIWPYFKRRALAQERYCETVERQLRKELREIGFPSGNEIDQQMRAIADKMFDDLSEDMGSYIFNNAPLYLKMRTTNGILN